MIGFSSFKISCIYSHQFNIWTSRLTQYNFMSRCSEWRPSCCFYADDTQLYLTFPEDDPMTSAWCLIHFYMNDATPPSIKPQQHQYQVLIFISSLFCVVSQFSCFAWYNLREIRPYPAALAPAHGFLSPCLLCFHEEWTSNLKVTCQSATCRPPLAPRGRPHQIQVTDAAFKDNIRICTISWVVQQQEVVSNRHCTVEMYSIAP